LIVISFLLAISMIASVIVRKRSEPPESIS
jgi:hypothetical protein